MVPPPPSRRWTPWILALTVWAAGCSRDPRQAVTVFAAASLAEPFRAMEAPFEAAHPGYDLELHFAGSQLLATQLSEGAGAQLFASADAAQLERAAETRALGPRHHFANNRVVVLVPEGSPIVTLEQLAAPGTRVVLAGEFVPAGRYAREALEALELRAAVEANLVSSELDVRGVVAKLRLGEADAGMAYASDLQPATQPGAGLRAIELPPEAQPEVRYELAPLLDTGDIKAREGAAVFVAFVLGPEGQASLDASGFAGP